MPSPAYRTWRGRIESGTFTHAQCRAFARNVARIADGYDPRPGDRSTLTYEEALELSALLADRPVALEVEHTAKGLAWLRRYGRKLAGPLGVEGSFPVERLERDFDRFLYDGGHVALGNDAWGYSVPEWLVKFQNGDEIRYAAFAWQGRPNYVGEWRYSRQAVAS